MRNLSFQNDEGLFKTRSQDYEMSPGFQPSCVVFLPLDYSSLYLVTCYHLNNTDRESRDFLSFKPIINTITVHEYHASRWQRKYYTINTT